MKSKTPTKLVIITTTRNRIGPATAFILFLCLCLPAWAVKVGWHDQMYLQLGDGVDLKRQQEPLSSPVIMGTNAVVLNTGGQSESVTFAQHTYDMIRSLSANGSVSLNSLVFNGSVGVSFFDQQSFDANDLTFVYTATRDFGDTIWQVADFTPDFKAVAANLRLAQLGEPMHAALTSRFGTHYVHGYQSAAVVSVAYSFHYDSASIRKQLSVQLNASYNSGFDSASFSAFVSSFFGTTDTTKTMSYKFYSSDPLQSPTNFDFSTAGIIQNMQQFTNLVARVESYYRKMDPARGKVTGYILDPIQTVPGYLPLLGGYVPTPADPADYNSFLQAYSALQVWKQRCDTWVLQRNTMSWLNAKGQQMVQGKRLDIANYLTAMKSIAHSHFTSGTALEVPSDIVNYLGTLDDIPLPEIYVMDSLDYGANHFILGRIYCGTLDLTTSSPFYTLSQLYYNTNKAAAVSIYYSAADFENAQLKALPAGYPPHTHLIALFGSSQWNSLTNLAATQDRTGFFVAEQPTAQAPNWTIDLSDADGNTVDQMPFLSTRSGGTTLSMATAGGPGVSLAITSTNGTDAAGLARRIALQVTNETPVQAYGTAVSFKLADNFEFAGASGSQGYASFDPLTRIVSYSIGPLIAGASADVTLQLIPLRAGLAVPAGPALLTLGEGLTNTSPNSTAAFVPIETAAPILNMAPIAGGIQLDWHSDTDRLRVEHTSALGPNASWSLASNTTITSAGHRFLTFPVTSNQNFFRLCSQ